MHWKKGKCELCVFWQSDMERTAGIVFDTRGLCLRFPDHPGTYTTNKCGSFRKVWFWERMRRARLTKRALLQSKRGAPTGISEKVFKAHRFMPKDK